MIKMNSSAEWYTICDVLSEYRYSPDHVPGATGFKAALDMCRKRAHYLPEAAWLLEIAKDCKNDDDFRQAVLEAAKTGNEVIPGIAAYLIDCLEPLGSTPYLKLSASRGYLPALYVRFDPEALKEGIERGDRLALQMSWENEPEKNWDHCMQAAGLGSHICIQEVCTANLPGQVLWISECIHISVFTPHFVHDWVADNAAIILDYPHMFGRAFMVKPAKWERFDHAKQCIDFVAKNQE